MHPNVLHFPIPEPAPQPQPQPTPHPTAPPEPGHGSPLPLPMIYMEPVWAYRHVQRPLAELAALADAELDALGADGWELAGVTSDEKVAHFFFKRLVR
jgi:hypothetical protein